MSGRWTVPGPGEGTEDIWQLNPIWPPGGGQTSETADTAETADSDRGEGILLSDVKEEDQKWLWAGRIPIGAVTVIDGDPGVGKSALSIDMAARVTTGRDWPDGNSCALGAVVICSAEDHVSRTIKPRFMAAQGEPSRTLYLDDGLVIPDDVDRIERAVRRINASMVIIDPLFAYLNGKVNSWSDQQVRQALRPLRELAEKLDIAIVVIRHLNKDARKAALYRGGGSIGIVGGARAGFVVGKDPDDKGRRVIASLKANLSEEAPTLGYRLPVNPRGIVYVDWEEGTSNLTAEQVLAGPTDADEGSALEDAQDFLYKLLVTGRAESKVVLEQAKSMGISEKTLRRAKRPQPPRWLGVEVDREGFGAAGRWWWRLIDGQGNP